MTGAPDNVEVKVTSQSVNDSLYLSLHIIDSSDAPAQSIDIDLVGLRGVEIVFEEKGLHIPVDHHFKDVLEIDSSSIIAADYVFTANAMNELGNNTADSQFVFLNGKKICYLKSIYIVCVIIVFLNSSSVVYPLLTMVKCIMIYKLSSLKLGRNCIVQ